MTLAQKPMAQYRRIIIWPPCNRLERKRMPVSSLGSQRPTPADHVQNLIQQKLPVGPMSQKSRHFNCQDRRRISGAVSKNPTVRLKQTNLAREILAAKDSEPFGNEFPTKPDPNVLLSHSRTPDKWTNTHYRPNFNKLQRHSKKVTPVWRCMQSTAFTKLVNNLSNFMHAW